jgi:hypothetical protein
MGTAGLLLGKPLGSRLGQRAELAASLLLAGIGVLISLSQLFDIDVFTAH